MRPNIDLTEDRDFEKDGNTRIRDTLVRGVNNTTNVGIVRHNSKDEFIKRLYRSDFLNHLFDNEGKICDRCGKYDHFNQMKYSLCLDCDKTFEVYKVEVFPTGNREMIRMKKDRWKKMASLENGLADINGGRSRMRFNNRRIPWG